MRGPRRQSEGNIYHVVARGTGRQLVFEDGVDYRKFLQLLSESLNLYGVELYAWCLMGNHVHLLVHAPISELSKCIMRVCGQYARYFNDKSGRVGHLFQERFKSEPIGDDAYLKTAIRYIHANPAKAGLATIEGYPWSSYREYVGTARLCKTEFALHVFGGVDSFRRFHQQGAESSECLDVDAQFDSRAMTEAHSLQIAKKVLEGFPVSEIKALPRPERNEKLKKLRDAGLSIRQIERLTGVGRNSIARI